MSSSDVDLAEARRGAQRLREERDAALAQLGALTQRVQTAAKALRHVARAVPDKVTRSVLERAVDALEGT